ncbi:hypothetical protein Tco_0104278 [Tanacetum coccineum]
MTSVRRSALMLNDALHRLMTDVEVDDEEPEEDPTGDTEAVEADESAPTHRSTQNSWSFFSDMSIGIDLSLTAPPPGFDVAEVLLVAARAPSVDFEHRVDDSIKKLTLRVASRHRFTSSGSAPESEDDVVEQMMQFPCTRVNHAVTRQGANDAMNPESIQVLQTKPGDDGNVERTYRSCSAYAMTGDTLQEKVNGDVMSARPKNSDDCYELANTTLVWSENYALTQKGRMTTKGRMTIHQETINNPTRMPITSHWAMCTNVWKRQAVLYECCKLETTKKELQKLKNRGNNNGNGTAQGRAYALGGRDASSDSNVITVNAFPQTSFMLPILLLILARMDRSFVSNIFSALINITPNTIESFYDVD